MKKCGYGWLLAGMGLAGALGGAGWGLGGWMGKTKDIPVIIFSSLVNDEMKKKGEALGADAQLSKPEIGNLVKIVDRLVDERHLAE